MKKKLSILLAIAMMLSMLTACGGDSKTETPSTDAPSTSTPAESSGEDYGEVLSQVSIGSTASGNAGYSQAAAFAEVVNKANVGMQVTAEETKGFVANIKHLVAEEVEFGQINNLQLSQVYSATGSYSELEPGQIMGVLSMAPAEMHIITTKNSTVTGLQDLHGKRVGVGSAGGVNQVLLNIYLEALGYKDGDFEKLELDAAQQAEYMADGQLDVILWVGCAPLSAITSLCATTDVKFLDVDDATFDILKEALPLTERAVIPAGTYEGQDADVNSICLYNMLVCRSDIPNETVYQFVKACMSNVEALGSIHASLSKLSLDTCTKGMTAETPLHPGALRYYKEIGVPGVEALEAK